MTSLEYFRLIAPQYENVVDETINKWLAMATGMYEAPCLENEENSQAEAYLAAHLLFQSTAACNSSGSGGGVLIGEKEGDLSRTYSASAAAISNSKNYNATWYGQMFLQITAPCFVTGILTRV